jgi:hypothetical protein
MKVRMHPGPFGALHVLRKAMSGVPVAAARKPECIHQGREPWRRLDVSEASPQIVDGRHGRSGNPLSGQPIFPS